MPSSPDPSPQRAFFDEVLSGCGEDFDLFDAHLYGDPTRIPDQLGTARTMMRAHGYDKPVVVGEYNGPALFQFPEAEAVVHEVMGEAFSEGADQVAASTQELREQTTRGTPEQRAMRALYQRADTLPDRLRMFLADCPPALAERRHRMSCRDLVMRNLLALSCGVRRTACWNLGPEIPGYEDPYRMMHLMFATFGLMDYEGASLTRRRPAADAFARLTAQLRGVHRVTRLHLDGHPDVYAFDVARHDRPPLLVAWQDRDPFGGEDEPPVPVTLPWSAPTGAAVDAFGHGHPVVPTKDGLRLDLSVTPVFVSAAAS